MMKTKRNQWLRKIAAVVCVFSLLCPALKAQADDLDNLENQSFGLQGEMDSINGELLKIGEQIAKNEVELESVNNDIIKTEEQLHIAKNNEVAHYDDMKIRIQYIYENGGESLLCMILSATSLPDFINKVYFVQKMSEYDRGMFNELKTLRCTIEDEEDYLRKQKEFYQNLEEELSVKREELNTKAMETSVDLSMVNAAITAMKAKRAAEEERKTTQTNAPTGGSGNNSTASGSGNNDSVSSGGEYNYPSGAGQLNPWIGVVYFNGHRETYYSQRVLPGGGLDIPGRHVASDGTIRDADGYICVASSDYPKGTIVETSLGTGKVYDTGCASGTIDIYTDW